MPKPTKVDGLEVGMPAREAGVRILASRLADVRRHEATLQRSLDMDAIHDMRVAARRLRAAMKQYATSQAVEQGGPAVKELQDALGNVRDGQIQLAWFEALDAAGEERKLVQALVSSHREALREDEQVLERALRIWAETEGPRVEALLGASDAQGKYGGGRELKSLRKRLHKVEQGIAALGERLPCREAHALRIRAKKVRYQAELLDRAYPKAVKPITGALTTLQDALGELHDLDVRRAEVVRFGRKMNASGRKGALQLMERLDGERRDTAAGIRDLLVDFNENRRIDALIERLEEAWGS